MTRPMSEMEMVNAISVASHIVAHTHPRSTDTNLFLARALLSATAAERGLREALEWMRDRDDIDGGRLPPAYREKIDAALGKATKA